ncbi:MAG TPA: L-threonylcarbamoyladenylate synthase [Armatimonadota bacterium]|jgi:L-threonylcarbamoyladenylate synthase
MSAARCLPLAETDPAVVRDAFVAAAGAGELLIFPTDTVYGLGARADDATAVARIFAAKQRPAGLPLPVLLSSAAAWPSVAAAWPPAAQALAAAFWPGALTLVVPRAASLSLAVTAGGETVGVRVPDHAALRDWLGACAFPLAVTSANLSGAPPATRLAEVPASVCAVAGLLLDGGPCPGGTASTVVDVSGPEPRILRPGPITEQELAAVWRRGIL